jgi:thiamine-phosphate pyrophosphorylase
MQSPATSHIEIMQKKAKEVRAASPGMGKDFSALPTLILVTDEIRLADPITTAQSMPSGSAVLFRHYGMPDRKNLAKKLAKVCRQRNLFLWVGGDVVLARTVGAHGLHLPEFMARRSRPMVPAGMTLTAAAHSYAAIRRAEVMGADAVLISPIFPSQSHPDRTALGPGTFRQWVGRSKVPAYPLGGIDPINAGELARSGGAGIAAITGLSRGV